MSNSIHRILKIAQRMTILSCECTNNQDVSANFQQDNAIYLRKIIHSKTDRKHCQWVASNEISPEEDSLQTMKLCV